MDLDFIISIIAAGVSIIGIYQFILSAISFFNRPKIEIGILPYFEIENEIIKMDQIGKRSSLDELKFNKKYFARKTNTNIPFIKMKKYTSKNRLIKKTVDFKYEFPIIIYNRGLSIFRDYDLAISFIENTGSNIEDSEIELLEVVSESANIDCLYVNKESYEGKKDLDKIPDERIFEIYKKCKLSANFVYLSGTLESGTYEMLYLKLLITEKCKEIAIYYEINSEIPFIHTTRFCQLVEIIE